MKNWATAALRLLTILALIVLAGVGAGTIATGCLGVALEDTGNPIDPEPLR